MSNVSTSWCTHASSDGSCVQTSVQKSYKENLPVFNRSSVVLKLRSASNKLLFRMMPKPYHAVSPEIKASRVLCVGNFVSGRNSSLLSYAIFTLNLKQKD